MPSACGNHYGFGYIENRVPSQDGSNSYRPPYIIPPCSPEFSGYGHLGKDDYSESPDPPIPRPPSPKDDPDFPGVRPGGQNSNKNTDKTLQSADSNVISGVSNENVKKAVVIGGAVLLSIVGIFIFAKNGQSKSNS